MYCVVSKTVCLYPNSEFLLLVHVDAENVIMNDGLFLPYKEKMAENGLVVASALVRVKNGQFYVRIYNTTNADVKLFKNTKIGQLQECEIADNFKESIRLVNRNESSNNASHINQNLTDIESSKYLSDSEKQQAKNLLIEYADIFSVDSNDIGLCNILKHKIDTGNSKPIAMPFRRIPEGLNEKVDNLVNDLLDRNIIRESNSPWAAPIVIVPKKNGDIRMCVDYRGLNMSTERPIYPIPDSRQLFDTLSGAKYFSFLDLSNGYYNLEVEEKDKKKTAFITRRGQFEFNRLPFGLCGAPATFQKLMNVILKDVNYQKCLIYLDDVLIFSNSFHNHVKNVKIILEKLRLSGVKLSPTKCFFFKKELAYLGHVISDKGIHTDPGKIEKLQKWERPKNLKELQKFLGFCNYYRNFVKDYTEIALPLENLLNSKSEKELDWSSEAEKSFVNLKSKLTSAPILGIPNNRDTFILDVDASYFGMGAVLSQLQDGQEKVIAFASKKFNSSQIQYCVTRKELLGVYTFIRQFHHYLLEESLS